MKHFFLILLGCLLACMHGLHAQSGIKGAWQLSNGNTQEQMVAICSDDYLMFAQYDQAGKFLSAGGGPYTVKDKQLELTYDYHTEQPSQVGKRIKYTMQHQGKTMTLSGDGMQMKWQLLSDKTTPLTGAWRFARRVDEEGNEGERRQPGARETVKILAGDRFQWAAFNTETAECTGTGGGTFSAKDGTYTETLKFFSRDDSRVKGSPLNFSYERKGDDWHHMGKSSKGEPMHEVWEKKP